MSTRPCARCGTRIPSDQHLCADCREERTVPVPVQARRTEAPGRSEGQAGVDRTTPDPVSQPRPRVGQEPPARATWRGRPLARGMILPSRTQYHGTMFAFIAAAVAVTMAAAVLINKGVGPFPVTGVHATSSKGAIAVTGLVRNIGTHPGRARCVGTWTNAQGGRQQTGVVQTPLIGADQAVTVSIPL